VTGPHVGPVPEAPMRTGAAGGQIPDGPGWYVLNVADAEWSTDGRTGFCDFEGASPFEQYGTNIHVLEPGEPNGSYHREFHEDESFFVLSGTCVVIIEGEERALRAGDYVRCPAGTAHIFVGTGTGRCAIFMFGGRNKVPPGGEWGVYLAEPAAVAHGAAVHEDTSDPQIAYATRGEFIPCTSWWTPS